MNDSKRDKKMIRNLFDRGKFKENKKKKHQKLKIISTVLAVLFITLFTIFPINTITGIQGGAITTTLRETAGKQSNVLAPSGTYSIFGETPFTEEYSLGAFCQATGVAFGTGFAHQGTQTNGNYRMVGTNTSKQSNIYRDAIGGFKMGTEVYDVRTYFWLIEGDDYAVWGSYAYGAYAKSQSEGDTFPDGYISKSVNTVIGLEIHFYKSGTLATNNPQEVSVKGIGCFSDNDEGEGYEFIKGVNGVWLTRDTTIKTGTAITDQLYQTPFGDAWIGTLTGESLDSQKIYYQFESSPSSPLTVRHYGMAGLHSGVGSEVHNVTYHIEGNAPSGISYPKDSIYVANYGTYTVINALSVSGYKFTGWNKDSINGTNVSGKKMAPVTSDIDLYGKFTMEISVKKVWDDNNDQDGKRPSSVKVTLYLNGRSTGKTLTLNSSNNWSGKFTDLDVESGYTVQEDTVSGYQTKITGSATGGFTVTNTLERVEVPETTTITIYNKYKLGTLKLLKQDKDDHTPLEGIGFIIKYLDKGQYITGLDPVTYGTESQAKVFYTDSQGIIQIDGLWEGSYEAVEVSVGDNYGYLVDSTPHKFTISARKTTNLTVYNEKSLGNVKIIKVDADNGLPLEGVGFKIRCVSTGQYLVGLDPSTYGTESQAKIFYTDSNGIIEIEGLLVDKYEAIEVSIGDNEAYVVDQAPHSFEIIGGETTELTITNKKVYVTVKGYVWEDIESSKMDKRNDLYHDTQSDNEDIRVDGIIVKILDENGNVVRNPETGKEQSTVTSNGGEYEFEKVVIDDLSKLTIQFTYDGLIYENVIPYLDKDNGSKAVEPGRQEFNNRFNAVEKGNKENQAAVKDSNDNTVASVDYTFRQYDSGRVADISETTNCEITADTKSADYILTYDRKQENTELPNVNLGIYKRTQADLAVQKELEQVKVQSAGYGHVYKYGPVYDENNAEEVQNSWDMGVRFESRYKGTYTRPIYSADAQYETADGSNEIEMTITYKITIANQETLPTRVNQILDYCDTRFTNINIGTGIDETNGNLTGTLASSSFRVNQESGYKRIEIDVNQLINPSSAGTNQAVIYVQCNLPREEIIKILSEGVREDDVNLTEKVEDLEERGRNLANIAEVSSFTTFSPDNSNLLYAAVDKDSIPENATPFDETTYEDDTDKSSSLSLITASPRAVSGIVFEDSENEQLRNVKNIVEGDSRYDESTENTIGGVKVQLVDTADNVAQIYDEVSGEWKEATVETDADSDGTYSISGFIPGRYKIKFTYGDGIYKILDAGNTENYTNMSESYKSTVINYDRYREISQNDKYYRDANTHMSYAIDNIQTRQQIDDNFKVYNFNSSNDIKEMTSTTPEFEINMEYEDDEDLAIDLDYIENRVKFNISNIDLGIIRRARSEINIEKSIAEIKLILANGQTLVDAQIAEDGTLSGQTSYLSYVKPVKADGKVIENGFVRIELDSNLMQGSTVILKYRFTLNNLGEADYINIDNSNEMFNYGYYKYGDSYYTSGIVNESQKQTDIVKISPTMIIDYLDEGVGYQPDDPVNIQYLWEEKAISDLESNQLVHNDVIDVLKTGTYNTKDASGAIISTETVDEKQIFTTDYFKVNNIAFRPKYSVGGTSYEAERGAVFMVVSQLLSSSDDVTIQNQAEIIEITKDGGGRTLDFVPGNYVPNKVNKQVDDSTSQELIVIPSTGLNKAYILPIMVLVISFVILGIGIYLIIVKVMKKEYR